MDFQWRIRTFEEVSSTQDILKQHIDNSPDDENHEGLVIHAARQAKGRGRHGRVWDSPQGNLYFSFCLNPHIPAARVGELALICSLAVAQAIKEIGQGHVSPVLKWPNDVLIGGRKCCGILIDADGAAYGIVNRVIIGIGINIAAAPLATSSCLAEFGVDADVTALRDVFLRWMGEYYMRWQMEGFEPLRREWMEGSFAVGTPMTVKPASGAVSGRFQGIDMDGALLLQQEDGRTIKITSGDVHIGL